MGGSGPGGKKKTGKAELILLVKREEVGNFRGDSDECERWGALTTQTNGRITWPTTREGGEENCGGIGQNSLAGGSGDEVDKDRKKSEKQQMRRAEGPDGRGGRGEGPRKWANPMVGKGRESQDQKKGKTQDKKLCPNYKKREEIRTEQKQHNPSLGKTGRVVPPHSQGFGEKGGT